MPVVGINFGMITLRILLLSQEPPSAETTYAGHTIGSMPMCRIALNITRQMEEEVSEGKMASCHVPNDHIASNRLNSGAACRRSAGNECGIWYPLQCPTSGSIWGPREEQAGGIRLISSRGATGLKEVKKEYPEITTSAQTVTGDLGRESYLPIFRKTEEEFWNATDRFQESTPLAAVPHAA
ncbi:hypothetical protein K438DRAFT_1768343 [Mycena galopus ATCC 62051]|nr:hypothetical protein K438DRAFT_1768343 [Mycena galopus ATCC 62051]